VIQRPHRRARIQFFSLDEVSRDRAKGR
jgi:hypothetical protein